MSWWVCVWCVALVLCGGCQQSQQQGANVNGAGDMGGAEKSSIKVTSGAFAEGEMIPAQFTCGGANVSPPLAWAGVPPEAKSLALVVEDPDAPGGTFVHWVVYNLPATAKELPQGVPARGDIAGGGRQGMNDFGKHGYGGPCPPPGAAHRYYFKLYALNADFKLPDDTTKPLLLKAIYGHIVDQGQLTGKYGSRQ